jgi:hypothetical protein
MLGPLPKTTRLAALLVVPLMMAASIPLPAAARDHAAYRHDADTCASFGAPSGSPGYSRCMLQQQRRRDDAPLRAAEQQQINADTAQRNLEMVRRIRCQREAKRARERGEPPQWC